MIFYIILFLIILTIVVWGGMTQWKFIKGKNKDYFNSDHVIIPPVKIDFKNDVAVVGHGPISEEDRKLINKFDTVYRMTRLTAWKKGDKTTHYLIPIHPHGATYPPREKWDAFMADSDGQKPNPNIKFYDNSCPALHAVHKEKDMSHIAPFNKFKDKLISVPQFCVIGGKFKIGNQEYESCAQGHAHGARIPHDPQIADDAKTRCQNSSLGFNISTGFSAIGLALHNHPKSNIHLFGYSWLGFYLKKGEPVHKFYKWRPNAEWINLWKHPINSHISSQDWDLGPNWPFKEGIAIIMTSNRCFIHPLNS